MLWMILFYAWPASEILLAVATRTRRKDGKLRDRWSFPVLWLSIYASITAAEYVAPWGPARIFSGAHWPGYAAVALMSVGLAIRWTAILSLGKAFSVNVAIRAEQKLYRSGLYGLVRHPSYSGMLLCFMAVALSTRNWCSAAIVLICPIAALLYRIHIEEAALNEAFGAEYASYSQQTKRLIPGIY